MDDADMDDGGVMGVVPIEAGEEGGNLPLEPPVLRRVELFLGKDANGNNVFYRRGEYCIRDGVGGLVDHAEADSDKAKLIASSIVIE